MNKPRWKQVAVLAALALAAVFASTYADPIARTYIPVIQRGTDGRGFGIAGNPMLGYPADTLGGTQAETTLALPLGGMYSGVLFVKDSLSTAQVGCYSDTLKTVTFQTSLDGIVWSPEKTLNKPLYTNGGITCPSDTLGVSYKGGLDSLALNTFPPGAGAGWIPTIFYPTQYAAMATGVPYFQLQRHIRFIFLNQTRRRLATSLAGAQVSVLGLKARWVVYPALATPQWSITN